jgi:NAD(P)-dependent dehydrogenase (short-subunit alcohol dehydrogenase family)
MTQEMQDLSREGCALVYAGSGGLGSAISKLLARRGANVVLTYRSHADSAKGVVAEIEAAGGKARAIECDVTDAKSVKDAAASATKAFGHFHTVVSATGIVFDTPYIADMPPQAFRNVIEVDVFGFFNIVQATVPALRARKGGSITALVTAAVEHTIPGDGLSSTPKTAVATLIRQVAKEEGPKGIRANGVGPGVINAGMVLPMLATGAKELLDFATKTTPLQRLGEAHEIAEAVAFLASPRASYITGRILMADGGLSA